MVFYSNIYLSPTEAKVYKNLFPICYDAECGVNLNTDLKVIYRSQNPSVDGLSDINPEGSLWWKGHCDVTVFEQASGGVLCCFELTGRKNSRLDIKKRLFRRWEIPFKVFPNTRWKQAIIWAKGFIDVAKESGK